MAPGRVRWLICLAVYACIVTAGIQSSGLIPQAPGNQSTQGRAQGAPLDDARGLVVPILYNPPATRWIMVMARINGSKPYPFVLDTGASDGLMICTWAQRELKLPLTGGTREIHPGNSIAQFVKPFELLIPGKREGADLKVNVINGEVADLALLDDSGEPRPAGILGVQTFLKLTSRFDFDEQTVTFFNYPHPAIVTPGPSASLPLQPSDSRGAFQISLKIPGMGVVPFRIDTGDVMTYLPAKEAKKAVRLASKPEGFHTDLSGVSPATTLMLPSVGIGGTQVNGVPVLVFAGAQEATMCLDLFTCFRVTLDPQNKMAVFEPRKAIRHRRFGDCGLVVALIDGKIKISEVAAFASAKSVAVNDTVVSIDGVNASDMSLVEATALLNGYEGTTVSVVVEKKGGTRVTAELQRRNPFKEIVSEFFGLTIFKERGKPARVVDVSPGSVAERAGVAPDDELMSVDGKQVDVMTVDEIYRLANDAGASSTHHVEIKRKVGRKVDKIDL